MSFRSYPISLGTPTVAQTSTIIIGSGGQGTVGALRLLTHPDSGNFPALTYFRNPDEDFNIDNDALSAPVYAVTLAEGTTQVTRSERNLQDVIVTEVWTAGGGQAAMPTSFFRLLYEYFANPPAFNATNQTFITWQPRDRNSFTYNVEFIDLAAGRGRNEGQRFHVKDVIESGSFKGTGVGIPTALDAVDPGVETGLLADSVTVTLRIVSKV